MTDKQQSYFRQQAPIHYDVMNAQVQRIREMAKQAVGERNYGAPEWKYIADLTEANRCIVVRLQQYLAERWGVTQFTKIPDADRHIALNDLFLREEEFAGLTAPHVSTTS